MRDHMPITRNQLAACRDAETHNGILHDESVAFAGDRRYPESDHAPVVAFFDFGQGRTQTANNRDYVDRGRC
jgi:hypothetical protein